MWKYLSVWHAHVESCDDGGSPVADGTVSPGYDNDGDDHDDEDDDDDHLARPERPW